MTTAEVASTMQEEAETGRPFAELAVEHGRIEADDLARLTEPEQAPAPPAPDPDEPPAPAAAAPQPVPAPVPLVREVAPLVSEVAPVASEPEPAASEPEPVASEPEPVVKIALEPSASAPVETPTAEARLKATVFVRLSGGERVSAGDFDSQEGAERRARELMVAVDAHGDWPCVDGRYIKPDAVVSIDVDL